MSDSSNFQFDICISAKEFNEVSLIFNKDQTNVLRLPKKLSLNLQIGIFPVIALKIPFYQLHITSMNLINCNTIIDF